MPVLHSMSFGRWWFLTETIPQKIEGSVLRKYEMEILPLGGF